MSRKIQKKNNTWSLVSTVSDEIVFTTDDMNELAKFIATDTIYRAKINAIQTLMCFPGGEWINGKFKKPASAANKAFYEWHSSLYDNPEIKNWNDYWDVIDKKFEELLLKHN